MLTSLGSARSKSTDAKVVSQLSSMRSQAELWTGTPLVSWNVGAGVAPSISSSPVNVFNDTNAANQSMYKLVTSLPSGTIYYYSEAQGVIPSKGGQWMFAAALTTGAFCVDWNGSARNWAGTPPTASTAAFQAIFTNYATFSCR